MGRLEVELCGLKLDNPIIPASGTFGYGREFSELYDLNILGSISIKGTTRAARFGNPTPRIAECSAGMLNSVGLQNPGIDKVVNEELPELSQLFQKKVVANISGFSEEEYVYCCERISECESVGIIEVNISCPNVKCGGMSFGTSAENAAKITRAVRRVTEKPIFMKLSPNVTDITEIARACESAGADGISMVNTFTGMRIDLKSRRPILANKIGGFSGSAIFPAALAMVYKTYEAVKIPIMGMGGISCAEDVIEMMLAGAAAVQIGAANLTEPFVCQNIIEALPSVMDKYGIDNLKNITGGAH